MTHPADYDGAPSPTIQGGNTGESTAQPRVSSIRESTCPVVFIVAEQTLQVVDVGGGDLHCAQHLETGSPSRARHPGPVSSPTRARQGPARSARGAPDGG